MLFACTKERVDWMSNPLIGNAAGAKEVMQFIIRKCNEDRKRILFISTHQKSIEAMAQRKFDIREDGDKNYIVEVKV